MEIVWIQISQVLLMPSLPLSQSTILDGLLPMAIMERRHLVDFVVNCLTIGGLVVACGINDGFLTLWFARKSLQPVDSYVCNKM